MSNSVQAALLSANTTEHDDESVVVDNDAPFVIDSKTKTITNTGDKKQITRGSHNSERITFECDRYIEGHDMLLCNVIRVHYFNVNTPGTYDITDVSLKPDDDSKIIFTWLVSSNATQNVGEIIFAIKFECVQDSGKVTYAWPTQINKELYCFDTLDNSETIVQENVDILEQWKQELFGSGGSSIDSTNGTIVSENADYAEVGEWSDGNPDAEDRKGYFVSVDTSEPGKTMVKSTAESDVRGVTIAQPAFAANASADKYDTEGNLLKQYDYVCFAGFAPVIDNGTCTVNGRAMPADDGTAVPSSNNMGYQVIERIDDTHVLMLVEPQADMMVRIKEDVSHLSEEIANKGNPTDEQITSAVSEYLTANPISGLTWGDVEDGEMFGITGTEDDPTEEEPTEPSYTTDNLAVYYDFTKYEDNYTGEVEDLSGNGIVPDIKNLEYSYSGRGGFLGNKLMLGDTDLLNDSSNAVRLGFNTEAVKTYPFTVEFYGHLRKSYDKTLADGQLGYYSTSLNGQWNMIAFGNGFKTVGDTSMSFNGVQGRITENAVYIWGSGNNPNSINAPIDLTIDGFNNSNIGEEDHHFVFVFEANAQQVYMDGQLVMSTSNSSCTMTSAGYMLMFPADLQADLKMLRVYGDKLTEYEVYTNYQNVIGGTSAVSTVSEVTETSETVTRKNIKKLDEFPVTMARAVYMNNSNTTVEDEIKKIKNGGISGGSIVLNAVIDDSGTVSFKNSGNVTVFTLNLAQMNVGALQLPRIYLNGDTTDMGEDSPVPMKFKYVDNDTVVEAFTETEWQGNSSLAFPIKNYGFDLYSDEAFEESLDVQFLPHMATDSYHLKANYIDPSNTKNLAGARLFDYVCKAISLTFPNDARCVVDGIPVEVYLNNKFNGIYTLNYKQSKSLFGMGDGEVEFIYRCEDGTGWGLFSGDSFPTKEEFDLIWEARYPKPEKLTHHDEIQRMLKWVNDATDDEFKTDYASYLNIDSVLAYNICGDIMAWLDNSAKNLTVCSWDGLVWYTIPYDMDMGMSDVTAIGMVNAGGNLWTKVNTNFADEKKAIYKTLRDSGMNADTIFALYSDILYAIGLNGYIADKKIKYIPYDNLDSRISFVEFDDYINYHKDFIKQRIELMDTQYGYTNE